MIITTTPIVFEVIPDGPSSRGYLRICNWPDIGYLITDIVIPASWQGRGHGSELLRRATSWADQNGYPLYLSPQPEGGWMDVDQIIQWYERHGFSRMTGWMEGGMQREPNQRGIITTPTQGTEHAQGPGHD